MNDPEVFIDRFFTADLPTVLLMLLLVSQYCINNMHSFLSFLRKQLYIAICRNILRHAESGNTGFE